MKQVRIFYLYFRSSMQLNASTERFVLTINEMCFHVSFLPFNLSVEQASFLLCRHYIHTALVHRYCFFGTLKLPLQNSSAFLTSFALQRYIRTFYFSRLTHFSSSLLAFSVSCLLIKSDIQHPHASQLTQEGHEKHMMFFEHHVC